MPYLKRLSFLFFIVLLPFFRVDGSALSERTANYKMDIFLDHEARTLTCKTIFSWKNPSQDTITEIPFHIYYNAFKNTESTFMQESGVFESFLGGSLVEEDRWGWTEITSFIDSSGNDLSRNMRYIHPDDDNTKDQTVLEIPLINPILPDDSARYVFEWNSKIPKTMPRTGYNQDYYFMVQWFPKAGVYEYEGVRGRTKGGWNCHQYHASGEYYADFGNYEVTLNVPPDFVIAASGRKIDSSLNDEYKSETFKVNDVIDFAWSTSPEFVEVKDKWKDVELKVFTYPYKTHIAERHFQATKNALEFFEEHIGAYPYPTFTVVDPPIHGLYSGAMEYPTMVSSLSSCCLPVGIRTPETLTTHEFIHQYFMQMIATHEQEEPWMDEGMTTYYEGKILDQYDGAEKSTIDWLGIEIGNAAFNRWEFFASDNIKIAEGNRKARDYNHGGYGSIAYNKTAIWLTTLEGIIGDASMKEVMRTYFDRWKFKHPSGQDFIDVVNEIVVKNHGSTFGSDMNWFFDQVLFGSDECDYAIASIENTETSGGIGYVGDDNHLNDQIASTGYSSSVIVHRLGEIQMPLEIAIEFENGDEVLEYWDGKSRTFEFTSNGAHKIVCAEIDPEQKITIDKNYINNSMHLENNKQGIRKYRLQFMHMIQYLMEISSFIF